MPDGICSVCWKRFCWLRETWLRSWIYQKIVLPYDSFIVESQLTRNLFADFWGVGGARSPSQIPFSAYAKEIRKLISLRGLSMNPNSHCRISCKLCSIISSKETTPESIWLFITEIFTERYLQRYLQRKITETLFQLKFIKIFL